jgi:small subunit ribosomal protein S5
VVEVNPVVRVRKGGRKRSYNALTVIGDRKGRVGVGFGKANEAADAIRKSLDGARKGLFTVPLVKGTIPHQVVGTAGASQVLLRPASPGTGVVAGGSTRLILEAAGVQDVLGKLFGPRNKVNAARATVDGLTQLRDAAHVARLRGRSVPELFA